MNEHFHATSELTKNQALVMGALSQSDSPLSAYTILDQLRDDGFRAPSRSIARSTSLWSSVSYTGLRASMPLLPAAIRAAMGTRPSPS